MSEINVNVNMNMPELFRYLGIAKVAAHKGIRPGVILVNEGTARLLEEFITVDRIKLPAEAEKEEEANDDGSEHSAN